MKINNEINSFLLEEDKFLFFDIFYKNNKIYLIMPIYDVVVPDTNIILKVNGIRLDVYQKYVKDSYEPIVVYIYDYGSEEKKKKDNEILKQMEELNNVHFKSLEEIKILNEKIENKTKENDVLQQKLNQNQHQLEQVQDKLDKIIKLVNSNGKIGLEEFETMIQPVNEIGNELINDNEQTIMIKFEQMESTNIIKPIEDDEEIIKDTSENIKNKKIEVSVEYDYLMRFYELDHIETSQNNGDITLTTLFKDDYDLFIIYYDYYKKQGIKHFYMYYNGKLNEDIMQTFNRDDVTLVEWNFKYWNDATKCKYTHHAQTGQMHHALYRYGKDNWEYMGFNDFDEYFFMNNNTIRNYVNKYNCTDVFGFCNKWSRTIDNKIPIIFPNKLITSSAQKYGPRKRSKNIYKTNNICLMNIHSYNKLNVPRPIFILNLEMFHFYNWSKKNRKIGNINQLTTIQ